MQSDQGVRLVQTPIAELTQLRARHSHLGARTIRPMSSVWEYSATHALEIIAIIDPGQCLECGIKVHTGDGEWTTIGYETGGAELFVDRTYSGRVDFSEAFPGRSGGMLTAVNGIFSLRIYVDCSSVEVFGNDGATVISSLIFPESATTGLECYARGSEARFLSLDVYQLQP